MLSLGWALFCTGFPLSSRLVKKRAGFRTDSEPDSELDTVAAGLAHPPYPHWNPEYWFRPVQNRFRTGPSRRRAWLCCPVSHWNPKPVQNRFKNWTKLPLGLAVLPCFALESGTCSEPVLEPVLELA
jgi:hypothetical protein